MEKKDKIKIAGHRGTWYVVDETIYCGDRFYLLSHEYWGDEAACLIVNEKCEVVLDDVWNGFDDLYEWYKDPHIWSVVD